MIREKQLIFVGWTLLAISVLVVIDFRTDYLDADFQHDMYRTITNYLSDFNRSDECIDSERTCRNLQEEREKHSHYNAIAYKRYERQREKLEWAMIAMLLLATAKFGWLAYRNWRHR